MFASERGRKLIYDKNVIIGPSKVSDTYQALGFSKKSSLKGDRYEVENNKYPVKLGHLGYHLM